MKTHELKTEAEFFEAVIDGSKTFEVRVNDRDFQVGDLLRLDEIRVGHGYTGRQTWRTVSYIYNLGVLPDRPGMAVVDFEWMVMGFGPDTGIITILTAEVQRLQHLVENAPWKASYMAQQEEVSELRGKARYWQSRSEGQEERISEAIHMLSFGVVRPPGADRIHSDADDLPPE